MNDDLNVSKSHNMTSFSFKMVKTKELSEDIRSSINSTMRPLEGVRLPPRTLVSLSQQCAMLLRGLQSLELSRTSEDVRGRGKPLREFSRCWCELC